MPGPREQTTKSLSPVPETRTDGTARLADLLKVFVEIAEKELAIAPATGERRQA